MTDGQAWTPGAGWHIAEKLLLNALFRGMIVV
jgi:hypothetical protein